MKDYEPKFTYEEALYNLNTTDKMALELIEEDLEELEPVKIGQDNYNKIIDAYFNFYTTLSHEDFIAVTKELYKITRRDYFRKLEY